jgi:hypothetical protein
MCKSIQYPGTKVKIGSQDNAGRRRQFMKGAGTASSPAAQPSSRQQPGTRQSPPRPFALHELALARQWPRVVSGADRSREVASRAAQWQRKQAQRSSTNARPSNGSRKETGAPAGTARQDALSRIIQATRMDPPPLIGSFLERLRGRAGAGIEEGPCPVSCRLHGSPLKRRVERPPDFKIANCDLKVWPWPASQIPPSRVHRARRPNGRQHSEQSPGRGYERLCDPGVRENAWGTRRQCRHPQTPSTRAGMW